MSSQSKEAFRAALVGGGPACTWYLGAWVGSCEACALPRVAADVLQRTGSSAVLCNGRGVPGSCGWSRLCRCGAMDRHRCVAAMWSGLHCWVWDFTWGGTRHGLRLRVSRLRSWGAHTDALCFTHGGTISERAPPQHTARCDVPLLKGALGLPAGRICVRAALLIESSSSR